MKSNRLSYILSIVALILSLCALFFPYLKKEPEVSVESLLVGVLAILVTVLLAWQIYKSVDFDKNLEKRMEALILNSSLEIFSLLKTPEKIFENIKYLIQKIHNASEENKEIVSNELKKFNEYLSESSILNSIFIDENNKNTLLELINKLEDSKRNLEPVRDLKTKLDKLQFFLVLH